MGYADVGCFGSKLNRTPNIDRMAAEGMKLTSWYTAPVCSPSRSMVMTGCYAPRVGIPQVLFPADKTGLSREEVTIAELLKQRGYATMCIGKWHLGDQPGTMPTDHGFDHYFGIPYSNDMGPIAEGARSDLGKPLAEEPNAQGKKRPGTNHPPLPLIRDGKVVQRVKAEEQRQFTRAYTQEAAKFIHDRRAGPFFLYMPHNAVHLPIYPHPEFTGRSPHGIYSDWVEEVDWSVGQVLEAVRAAGIENNTLVMFTSDNGGTPRAVNSPLRGNKGSTWEGGVRDPAVVWAPGRIKPGSTSDMICGNIDLLPTFAHLAGAAVPTDRVIDGRDLWPVLSSLTTQGPHDTWHYYRNTTLEAVRHGDWKLFVDGPQKNQLYNLRDDIGESRNVIASHPDVVAKLTAVAQRMIADIGPDMTGPGARRSATFPDPKPYIAHDGTIRPDGR
jgi:arylsulfatase A